VTGDVGPRDADILHATTVALGAAGVLIIGPSGSGKSALALQLMALGADLVADDRTVVTATVDGIIATAPPALHGLIEARGLGILHAPVLDRVRLYLVVDMGQTEVTRLPPAREMVIKGHAINLVFGSASAHFPAALLAYVAGGRYE
jgi:HPr kinase/phosphorylase